MSLTNEVANYYTALINKYLDIISIETKSEKADIALALNILIHQSKENKNVISPEIANKIKPITQLFNEPPEELVAAENIAGFKELVTARIAAKIDSLNPNERRLYLDYREMTRVALDNIPIANAEEGIEIANALEALIHSSEIPNSLPMIAKKIEVLVGFLNEPEDYAKPEDFVFYKEIVSARIAEKVDVLRKNPAEIDKLISIQKENKAQAAKYKEMIQNKVPPQAGSEASTVPRNEEEWMLATVACIEEINDSPLGRLFNSDQLYGWANDGSYSEGVWQSMSLIKDNASDIADVIDRFHLSIVKLKNLKKLTEGSLIKLNKWMKKNNIPFETLDSEKKEWMITYPEKALKWLQELPFDLLEATPADELGFIAHFIEKNEINGSLNKQELRKLIDEKLNTIVSNFNVDEINQKKIYLKKDFSVDMLPYLLKKKGDQLKFLHIEFISPKLALELVKLAPNIDYLKLHFCSLEDNEVKEIIKSLKYLTSLDLGWNNIDVTGAREIAHANNLQNLTRLYLNSNKFGDEGVKELVSVAQLKNLKELNLNSNDISIKGIKEIVYSKYLNNLTELYLDNNCIDDEGAFEIAHTKHFENLKIFSLGDNYISFIGASEIIGAKYFPNLTVLDLRLNNMDAEKIIELQNLPNFKNTIKLQLPLRLGSGLSNVS